ncbi:class I SAM-dependent methyltransferase [Devosia sp. CAU 1758]
MNSFEFIRQRLTLKPLPFRPDISLYSPTPRSGLNGWLAAEGHDEAPPYWAYAWGGGAVLALYLRDHPELVLGRTVLDFGAGSGLVGIAALKAGAACAWAIETDPVGQVALRLNAEANGVDLPLWTGAEWPQADVVLAGDIFYLPEVVDRTLPILTQSAARGATVVIGDPFRRDLPLDRLKLLTEYQVPDMGSNGPVRAGIFALHP